MIDYLYANSTELIILGAAFCFSKNRVLNTFLISYVCIMTITFGINQDYLEWLIKSNVSANYYNKEASIVYFYEAFIMVILGVVIRFNLSKLSLLTLIVISTQAFVSLFMAMSHRFLADFKIYVGDWALQVHYFSQLLFVILYCVIAWMCVYYSRKMQ